MGFFDAIGSAVGSVASGALGGVVGAAGAIAGKVIDLKLKDKELEAQRIANEFQLALRDKDMAQAAAEAASKLEVTKIDADSAAVTADLASLQASVAADKATYGDSTIGRIVDAARGLIRPLLTVWAASAMSYLGWLAYVKLGGVPLTPDQALGIWNDIMFTSGLAVTWWFGARPSRAGK